MSVTAPIITNVTVSTNSATIFFTPAVASGGFVITNYEYSLDNGVTWNMVTPTTITSPIIILGLVNGELYVIKLRAIDQTLEVPEKGLPSNAVNVIPAVYRCCVNITASIQTYLQYAEGMGLTQSAPLPA